MSTITETHPVAAPGAPESVPSPESLYRITIDKYEAMVRSGVFTKRDRFHLLNGFLVAKMTEYPLHSTVCEATRAAMEALLPAAWHVSSERPVKIADYSSIPEPDLAIVRGIWWDHGDRHPEPADNTLVVEVAHTSLRDDRALIPIYAKGGIPLYWIINPVDRQVELYSNAGPNGYQSSLFFTPGDLVPLVIAGAQAGQIAVADLLPRRH